MAIPGRCVHCAGKNPSEDSLVCPPCLDIAFAPFFVEDGDAAKSTSGVLTNVPGKIACQVCGCRNDPPHAVCKEGCTCLCHRSWN